MRGGKRDWDLIDVDDDGLRLCFSVRDTTRREEQIDHDLIADVDNNGFVWVILMAMPVH